MQYDDNIVKNAIDYLENKLTRGVSENMEPFNSYSEAKRFLFLKLGGLEHEVFSVMFLDNRHRLISYNHMFRGTIDGVGVYPREVVKVALEHNAAAVIFAHNHPSGDTAPSSSDKTITDRLFGALSLFDIRIVDHIIIGVRLEDTYSFCEKGIL